MRKYTWIPVGAILGFSLGLLTIILNNLEVSSPIKFRLLSSYVLVQLVGYKFGTAIYNFGSHKRERINFKVFMLTSLLFSLIIGTSMTVSSISVQLISFYNHILLRNPYIVSFIHIAVLYGLPAVGLILIAYHSTKREEITNIAELTILIVNVLVFLYSYIKMIFGGV